MDELSTDDGRSKDAEQFDATMDVLLAVVNRLDKLLADEKRGSNNNNFQVTSGGWVSIVCACLAVCCLFGSLGIGLIVIIETGKQTAELHDLRAWRDVHSNEIGTLKSKVQQLEARK